MAIIRHDGDLIVVRGGSVVSALDVEKLPLQGRFGGKEARAAVQGHVLGQASLTGRYSLNPSVKL